MTAMEGVGPGTGTSTPVNKKSAKQMVSRDDLIKAIQKMQLPPHQGANQQVYPPTQVIGANG